MSYFTTNAHSFCAENRGASCGAPTTSLWILAGIALAMSVLFILSLDSLLLPGLISALSIGLILIVRIILVLLSPALCKR